MSEQFHCGYIALVGRPNVGKSTLLNQLVGQKLSITSRKPQTTRHQIVGIDTQADAQFIYIDTPGIHKANKRALHRYLNKAAKSAIQGVHVIAFLVEALSWTDEDELVLQNLQDAKSPVLLVVNKVDLVQDKEALLPFIQKISASIDAKAVLLVSAKQNRHVDDLKQSIKTYLPESEAYYPDDQLTNKSSRFIAAEIVREKLIRFLGDELPYSTTVEIEKYDDQPELLKLHALIWVERDNQKAIVIGKQGKMLKKIGISAREDLQQFFDKKVHLQTWVKVRSGWSDDERALHQLGYQDELE